MTLKEYIEEKGMNVQSFSLAVGIQYSQIDKLVKNPNANITIKFVERLYQATKRLYGVGLKAEDYLNIYK